MSGDLQDANHSIQNALRKIRFKPRHSFKPDCLFWRYLDFIQEKQETPKDAIVQAIQLLCERIPYQFTEQTELPELIDLAVELITWWERRLPAWESELHDPVMSMFGKGMNLAQASDEKNLLEQHIDTMKKVQTEIKERNIPTRSDPCPNPKCKKRELVLFKEFSRMHRESQVFSEKMNFLGDLWICKACLTLFVWDYMK